MTNCWQSSDKKESNEVTQANNIKENPKEDFSEEEVFEQSNDTIITPKDVQVNEMVLFFMIITDSFTSKRFLNL